MLLLIQRSSVLVRVLFFIMALYIQHVSLLQIQRDLHDLPRSEERFQAYLQLMTEGTDEVILPPLMTMNPMGREHVAQKLDEWLALDGDAVAVQVIQAALARLPLDLPESGNFQHGLVVVDDIQGGWTNRYTTEASLLFENSYALKHHWMTTPLWASEPVSQDRLRQEVFRSAYRSLHILQQGLPKTVRQMMAQEGAAAHFAQMELTLDEDDLAYSQQVIEPYLDQEEYPLAFAAMYGDSAAKLLGYEPLGLSDRAGFEVALVGQIKKEEQPNGCSSFE